MLATKERCPAVEPSTGKLVRRHNEEKKKKEHCPTFLACYSQD